MKKMRQTLKNTIFHGLTPCRLVQGNGSFAGTHFHRLLGQRVSQTTNQQELGSSACSWLLAFLLLNPKNRGGMLLRIICAPSPDTWPYISEDSTLKLFINRERSNDRIMFVSPNNFRSNWHILMKYFIYFMLEDTCDSNFLIHFEILIWVRFG
jgi:hypothetical protein